MRRQFSLIVPTYNVERYLGDFLESLSAQTYPIDDIEIVFVDDGSSDSSAEIVSRWISVVAPTARLLQKKNGGLSSARNLGLDVVNSRWVTFSDPDDTLSSNYFAGVARFLAEHEREDIHLVACRLLMLDDRTRELTDTHPLRFRFAKGNRVVDLDRHPQYVHLSAASAFYRMDLIERRRMRFDDRVQPNFEDGHFTGRYLADQRRPRVAFLRDPAYNYRRRADMSSLVQDSWSQPAKLTEVPRYGHLDLLAQVDVRHGGVPVWLQNVVLYDLLWYFKYDELADSPLGSIDEDVADEFHNVLPQILRHIDTATIKRYRITSASTEIRNSLIIAKGERLRPARLRIERTDGDQRIAEVRYCYGGELPREEFRRQGLAARPVYEKCRSLSFVGKRIASERIVWLPTPGRFQLNIDGRDMRMRRWSAPDDMDWYRALRWRAALVRRRIVREADRVRGFVYQLRTTGFRGGPYRNAWVFVDRNRLAGDNAEHLYRFVRENHPQINAWFVVDRDTKDWSRLDQEGFRLVEYGTPEHRLLMLSCAEVISSHIDDGVIRLIDAPRFGTGRCRFTFLQHGVTKDDKSRWLNRKPLSRFITAANAEYESIVGDGTPYVFTARDVRLTGFPRHDRLLHLAQDPELLAADRLLLIMPTSRRDLAGDPTQPGGDCQANPRFRESPYARNWLELLESERLRAFAERIGMRVAFIPHPDMSDFLTRSLPCHVEAHQYEDIDIQQLFARGAAIVTDYSSNDFELAFLNRPVIYFQFDGDSFYSGQCGNRRGVWSYEQDGFGPVVGSVPEVIGELERLASHGMMPQEPYASRMAQAFAYRDGRSCERVFESILSIRRPRTQTDPPR